MIKRAFWTVARGSMVGYVEAVGTSGILFSNKSFSFRPTTSNLSNHGQIIDISVSKYAENAVPLLEQAMKSRTPVTITCSQDLFDWPTKGSMSGQMHLRDVKIDSLIADITLKT